MRLVPVSLSVADGSLIRPVQAIEFVVRHRGDEVRTDSRFFGPRPGPAGVAGRIRRFSGGGEGRDVVAGASLQLMFKLCHPLPVQAHGVR
ncbi:hypothetical protein MBH78_18410 [Oceanimonas sp. NS1]|nr:hypothetical protein [Oceanimonas sp. NS1]